MIQGQRLGEYIRGRNTKPRLTADFKDVIKTYLETSRELAEKEKVKDTVPDMIDFLYQRSYSMIGHMALAGSFCDHDSACNADFVWMICRLASLADAYYRDRKEPPTVDALFEYLGSDYVINELLRPSNVLLEKHGGVAH